MLSSTAVMWLDRRRNGRLDEEVGRDPLMYEAWEFRAQDVHLEAWSCDGIRVAGTNERHPAVDVFSYLGIMANKCCSMWG